MEPVILQRGAFVLNRLDFDVATNDPKRPHCPYNPNKEKDNSGVTIGRGFDIAAQYPTSSKAKECEDFFVSMGVPQQDAKELSRAAGVTKNAAVVLAKELREDRGIVITTAIVFNMFEHSWGEAEDKLNAALANWGEGKDDVKNGMFASDKPEFFKGWANLHPALKDAFIQLAHSGGGAGNFKLIVKKTDLLKKLATCKASDIAGQARIVKTACENALNAGFLSKAKNPASLYLFADRIEQTATAGIPIVFVNETISLESMLASARTLNNPSFEWCQYIEDNRGIIEK